AGGEPEENAAIFERLVAGEPGPILEITAANAGAALYVAGRVDSLRQGALLAREVIASGAAAETLDALRRFGR
ncbi:MAG: anthranilate phosphoribosyltransferase, partial [Acidobacteriota bacterium]